MENVGAHSQGIHITLAKFAPNYVVTERRILWNLPVLWRLAVVLPQRQPDVGTIGPFFDTFLSVDRTTMSK